jgi:creatinine amidohydrolase
MLKSEVLLEKLTYKDVEQFPKDNTIILQPMGPLEAHGPHLPLGTDFFAAAKLCEIAVPKIQERGINVLIAPVLPYTLSDVAMPFAGTVTLSKNTVIALISDIIISFSKHGFKYFVLLCHHLERPNLAALNEAASRITASTDLFVLVSNAILNSIPSSSALMRGERPEWDFHAGEAETSFCLWMCPELVKRDIQANLPPNWSNIREKFAEGARDFVEAGGPLCYFGDPQKGTAELGEQLYQRQASALAEEIANWFQKHKSL